MPVPGRGGDCEPERTLPNRLLGAIKAQVQAFQKGLGVFFSARLLSRLRAECTPTDVKLLLCGASGNVVGEWQASAEYEGGFAAAAEQVVWFWSVIAAVSAITPPACGEGAGAFFPLPSLPAVQASVGLNGAPCGLTKTWRKSEKKKLSLVK